MTKMFFLSLIFSLGILIPPPVDEIYFIIHVKGSIVLQKDQIPLKTGMKIMASDQLNFKTKDAMAVVTGSERGRFVIKNNSNPPTEEMIAFAKDVVEPLKTNTSISTRSMGKKVSDFRAYFGDSTFYVIGDKLEFEVDPAKYKPGGNQNFQVRYKLGDYTVNPNATSGNIFTVNNLKLHTAVAKEFKTEKIEVFWVVNQPRSVEKLATFQPIFINEDDLKAEYKALMDALNGKTLAPNELTNYLEGYFRDVYGRTDKAIFDEWLEKNVKNKR
jgi:hypothetical protein